MQSRLSDPSQPAMPSDEGALLAALTAMLRAKRQSLLQGDMSAQALAPLWQPLLDRLQQLAARRADGTAAQADARLRAQAQALREEYEGLQHSLQVWSDALRVARDKAAQRAAAPVYGRSAAAAPRGSLGRG